MSRIRQLSATGRAVSRRRWWCSGEQIARPGHSLGRDLSLHCKFAQQAVVGGEMIEDPEQEVRLKGSIAQRLSFDPRERQEPAEPFRLFGQKTERLDCEHLREFTGHRLTLCHQELVCAVVSLRITDSGLHVHGDSALASFAIHTRWNSAARNNSTNPNAYKALSRKNPSELP